ncbi:MAG: hypothetical protein ACI8XB_002742 [Patiriisocius sp.]|jgi:hypothetical protein
MKNSYLSLIVMMSVITSYAQNPAGNAFRVDYNQFLETGDIKYFNCGNNEILNPGDELTIMTWIQLRDIGDNQKIVGKHNLDESGYILAVQADQVYTEVWNPFHYQPTEGSMNPVSMYWFHIAFTYKRFEAIRTYINGEEIASNNVNDNPIVASDNDLIIGVSSWADMNSFQTFGNMDGIGLYNVALTEDEIKAKMFREFTGDEPGLIAAYNFNETEGSVASDISGNGNNGVASETFNGTEWVESQAVMADENTSQALDLNGLWNAISMSDPRFTITENGMNLVASGLDTTAYALFGHDGASGTTDDEIPTNAPSGFLRTTRTWPLTELGSPVANVIINLNLAAAGGDVLGDGFPVENYTLLWRSAGVSTFEAIANGSLINNGVVVFNDVELTTAGSYSIGVGDSPIVLSIDENIMDDLISISPNPSHGIVNVRMDSRLRGEIEMEVFDVTGKRLLFKALEENYETRVSQMNLSDYAKGVYMIRVSTEVSSFVQRILLN